MYSEISSYLKSFNVKKIDSYFGFGVVLHKPRVNLTSPSAPRLIPPKITVEPNSPAELAGLKRTQRIVAINNKFLNEDLKSLDDLIKEIDTSYYQEGKIEFLVIENEDWEAHECQLSNEKSKENASIIPKLCKLTRKSTSDLYGFDFKTSHPENIHTTIQVRGGCPAQLAGLKNNHTILEVNSQSVEGMTHEQVLNLIATHSLHADLLVVEDYDGYVKGKAIQKLLASKLLGQTKPTVNKIENVDEDLKFEYQVEVKPIEIPSLPSSESEPMELEENDEPEFKQCVIVLTKTNKNFGFDIAKNVKPKFNVFNLKQDSPAYQAGLRNYDVIIEINGKNIRKSLFSSVMKLILQAKSQRTINLTAIDIRGYLWYKNQKKTFSKIQIRRDRLKSSTNANSLDTTQELPDRVYSKSLNNIYMETKINGDKPRISVASAKSTPATTPKRKCTSSITNLQSLVNQIDTTEKRSRLPLMPESSSTPLSFYNKPYSPPNNFKDEKIDQKWMYFYESSKQKPQTLRSDSFEFKPNDVITRIARKLSIIEVDQGMRMCVVKTRPNEALGFNIIGVHVPGIFEINDLIANSTACKSGLKNGDYIVEINDASVEYKSFDELVDFVKQCKVQNELRILVINRHDLHASNRNNPHVKKISEFTYYSRTNSLKIYHKLRGSSLNDIETRL